MITNFEEVTANLTDAELAHLQPLVNGLSKRTKANPIKADAIVAAMNAHRVAGTNKFTQVTLRKLANHIRTNGVLPLIATSEGYYCSTDVLEISKQIESLEQRARSIQRCATGLQRFIKNNNLV